MRGRLVVPPPFPFPVRLRLGWLFLERLVWAATVTLSLVVFTVTIPIRYRQLVGVAAANAPYLDALGLSEGFLVLYIATLDGVAIVTFCLIATVIVWRRSDDWLALLASALMLLVAVMLTRPVESMMAVNPVWRLPYVLTLALGMAAIMLFLYTFPDGRFVPAWSRGPAFISITWVINWFVLPSLLVQPMPWPPHLQPGWAVAGWLGSGIAMQIYRYRVASTAVQRQQTKWIIAGVAASAVGFLAFLYVIPTLLPVLQAPGVPHVLYILAGVPALYLALLLLPAAIGVSILRYRLWDISVIVNRTLVYGALTLVLTVVYLVSVLLLQPIFGAATGQSSPLAMAVSTLATAVLFYPLRQRVQNIIDINLFPDRYIAARVLNTLSVTLRDEVDLSRIVRRLQDAANEVLRPVATTTWLGRPMVFRPMEGDGAGPASAAAEVAADDTLVAALSAEDVDVIRVEELSCDSPGCRQLRNSSAALVVPLRSQGKLSGWLSLGPRRDERGYSADDLDFLSRLAAQASPAIRVAQLALEQQAAALERQRLDQQLNVARLVQQRLLPQRWPEPPGWGVAAHCHPAQAVGGDFYDFFPFKDGRLGIVIGDVSDKGIPAALLMATTRSLLRSVAFQRVAPGSVLARTNRLLRPDMPEGLFVTCLYAVLDPATGRLTLANAGHNPPCYRTAKGVVELWATGTPLGWLPEVRYEEHTLWLAPGECLLLYSDGVTEATGPNGALFGTERLYALLKESRAVGGELIDYLLEAVADFSGADSADDDMTVVTLYRRRTGATGEDDERG